MQEPKYEVHAYIQCGQHDHCFLSWEVGSVVHLVCVLGVVLFLGGFYEARPCEGLNTASFL